MTLTSQQKHIIDASKSNNLLSIEALAGSGKSSTMMEIVKKMKKRKFLLIVFSKQLQLETEKKAKKLGLSNLSVRTINAMAYSSMMFGNKWDIIPSFKYYDVEKYIKSNSYHDVYTLFNKWVLNDDTSTVIDKYKYNVSSTVANDTTKLIKAMGKNGSKVTHSFYMKMYMIKVVTTDYTLKKYDTLILDEAQDTSVPAYMIFKHIKIRYKIKVGDSLQSIFAFANLKNSLKDKDGFKVAKLTKSFRLTPYIASKVNDVCNSMYWYDIKMEGGNNDKPRSNYTKAIICRTNAGILEYYINNLLTPYSYDIFRTSKNPTELFENIFEVHKLLNNKTSKFDRLRTIHKEKTKNDPQEFNSWLASEYIKDSSAEVHLSYMLITKYNMNMLFYAYKLAKKIWNSKRYHKNVILTAHSSKGLEFDAVKLYNDFSTCDVLKDNIIDDYKGIKGLDHDEIVPYDEAIEYLLDMETSTDSLAEVNLVYVAITRAKYRILLHGNEEHPLHEWLRPFIQGKK